MTTPVTMGSLKSLIMIRVVESSKMMGSPSWESGPWRLFFGRNWVYVKIEKITGTPISCGLNALDTFYGSIDTQIEKTSLRMLLKRDKSLYLERHRTNKQYIVPIIIQSS